MPNGSAALRSAPRLAQRLEQCLALEQRGVHRRRLPGVVALVGIALGGQQALGDAELTLEDGAEQGGIAALVLGASIGPGGEQALHGLAMAVVGRQDQGGIALVVGAVQVVTGPDEFVEDLVIAEARGIEEVVAQLLPDRLGRVHSIRQRAIGGQGGPAAQQQRCHQQKTLHIASTKRPGHRPTWSKQPAPMQRKGASTACRAPVRGP